MGFNKKYVPELEELKRRLAEHPESLRHYLNADALIGPVDSMRYIDEMAEKQKKEEESAKK
jgi:hypothetical protein